MIKTVIKLEDSMSQNDKLARLVEIEKWMTENFGPAVPRDNNKQRRRRKWSTKLNYWDGVGKASGTVEVFLRDPQNATLVALRWL